MIKTESNSNVDSSWENELSLAIARRAEQVLEVRRWMHRNPELSGFEFQTSQQIQKWLQQEGIDSHLVTHDQRGVVCNLGSENREQPLLALRGDIDALPIQDSKTVEYHSCVKNVMHACGHDVHTAVTFGAILALNELSLAGQLPWPIRMRGIFQPAEETCSGAREMIQAGVIDDVQSILALHVDPSHRAGIVGWRIGALTASCDELIFKVKGHGGHAARPHLTLDPISAGAQLINSLYTQIPRCSDSQQPLVCSISQFTSGETANVIPDTALLRGTLRALDPETRQNALVKIQGICDGISKLTGTRIEFERGVNSPSVINDEGLTRIMKQASQSVLGRENVFELERPSMGGEDFAFYLERIPGCLIRLGCGCPDVGRTALHTPSFDVNESVLSTGAAIFARSIIQLSNPELSD